MAKTGIERLTGDLKSVEGDVVVPALAVELDKLGAIHVAAFRAPRSKIEPHETLILDVPPGRTIDLAILPEGFQPDGTVRAAVVSDSGQPGYGLGLEPVEDD
ncbi:hypothetical protein [Paludisphaera mucosa]|uniref:Uncharacterized protein n=1 Tax=Paludisphaera mucosa TaxID=3030827 RepID=A0ABT6F4C0_9BACT|nr:hypothetical protein [Paludisphaera mucosa]MDG3002437.1 hypothetical protein [Paludisphaera mucosa]